MNWKRFRIVSAIIAGAIGVGVGTKVVSIIENKVNDAMQDMLGCNTCRTYVKHGALITLIPHMQNAHGWSHEIATISSKRMLHRYYHNKFRKEQENASI